MGFTRPQPARSRTLSDPLLFFKLVCVIVGVCICITHTTAFAQRIVLFSPPPNDALLSDAFYRLEAELTIHQFEISTVNADLGGDPSAVLTRTADQSGAVASMALLRRDDEDTVQVWLADRISGKVTLRALHVQPSDDAASLLAIRAVDLLRASLREFSQTEKPPDDIVNVDRGAVPAAVRRLTNGVDPSSALTAGALALCERPRLGFGAGPLVVGSYRISKSFGSAVSFAGPVMGIKFTTNQGSASLRQELSWASVTWEFVRMPGVHLSLEGLGGVLFLQAQGQPNAPLIGLSSNVWGALWGGGVQSRIMLGPRVGIDVALRALGTMPHLAVALYDQRAAISWPILAFSTGLSVAL